MMLRDVVVLGLVAGLAACAVRTGEPSAVASPDATSEAVSGGTIVLDAFDRPELWTAAPATGVAMRLSGDAGVSGSALRVDFDFRGGGGWAAFRRELPVRLPENYEITFRLRGDAPVNTLEFKLIDGTGANVWWVHRPDFEFRGDWREVTFRRRHVTFAWGPAEGGEIRDVAAIEFAITAGTGGSGTVWIDSLTLTPRAPVLPYDLTPVATGAGSVYTIDFQRMREFGGLIVHWDEARRAADYDLEASPDGAVWQVVREVRGGATGRDWLFLPESESRYLRLRLHGGAAAAAVQGVTVQPIEWGESRNALFESIAAAAPRGRFPKYFGRVQSYWTLIGVNGGPDEAMINEEGAVEVGKRAFSIEPFLHDDGRLITWADAQLSQSLLDGYLPVPSVQWAAGDLRLEVTGWADGPPPASHLWLRYRVSNAGRTARTPTLLLALRPFQVNPSWQFLNNPGGVATVREITYADSQVLVDGRYVVPVSRPSAFGAATFDGGGVMRHLERGAVPGAQRVTDPQGLASGALAYALTLAPGESRDVIVSVPLTMGGAPATRPNIADAAAVAADRLAATARSWRQELDRFAIELPAHAPPLGDLVRSNLAWVLINRDGAAIQPGSRSYERSWIRDGSLTSAALLRLGHEREVREFIDWYTPFQYENGKVPCCVDHRGADPVPEHDSHGQLIYLIAEYFRFTGDTAVVRDRWRNVAAAVAHIDSLRQLRMTPVYRTQDSLPFYGMVPQSISHEGYSAKPMHSYWDAFFVLRGLKDAAFLANVLGRREDETRFGRIRDEFQRHLVQSLRRTMAWHDIDYLPGAVELGDFDATSTTVGITPAGELESLRPEMERTFERYWQNFTARRDGAIEWDAYTPYELRTIGTFVRLGQRERAHDALRWFMRDIRPAAWNHWAEVVWRRVEEPRFIGDMPHGWVGSDFIRSITDMFAFTREHDDVLVLGAGVLAGWLRARDSISVRGLRTPHGTVSYTIRRVGNDVEVVLQPGVTRTGGGIVIVSPLDAAIRSATADGRPVPVIDNEVRPDSWPRRVLLRY